jgi:hypothetical protein
VRGCSGVDRGEGWEPSVGVEQVWGPGPGAIELEVGPSCVAYESGGDVEQRVAKPAWFGDGEFAVGDEVAETCQCSASGFVTAFGMRNSPHREGP